MIDDVRKRAKPHPGETGPSKLPDLDKIIKPTPAP
jgi:hypothetical protein